MKTIYLAGPITGKSWEDSTSWRDDAIKRLAVHSIRGLSPLRGKNYLSGEKILQDNYGEHVMSTAKGITYRDMNDVRQSDVILVNLLGTDKISIGTVLEIGAAYVLNKPIVLVMEETNIHKHAMILTMCGWVVDNIQQGLDIAIHITGVPNYYDKLEEDLLKGLGASKITITDEKSRNF